MNNNRVTKEDILAQIGEVRYEVHGKLTLAFVTMANGFQDIGKSACVDPANFNKALGEEYALEDFIQNIWPKMGYALQDRNYRAAQIKSGAPADPMFDDFVAYESKPIVRMAMEITDENRVIEMAVNDYTYAGIRFKAYKKPVAGDYIVRLTREDTYHVERGVFHERNVVS
jgi:hypothetical protein